LRYRPAVDLLEDRVLLATHWVLKTGDSGPLTLRQAILDSNADPSTPRFIKFDLPNGPCSTISPLSPLPPITQPVTIDATTQPGSGGLPAVQLEGSSAGVANGLVIQASNTQVKGLVINRFARGDGILITAANIAVITNDVITDNYIGTDCTGTTAVDTTGNKLGNGNGVVLNGNVMNALIGRIVGGAKNVISGNLKDGIDIGPSPAGQQLTGNRVEGNYIGTDVTGTTAFDASANPLGNASVGVALLAGAVGNTVGGSAPLSGVCDAACNLVSGNGVDGVSLLGSAGTVARNLVQGNYVGTDVTGTTVVDPTGNRLGNGRNGVLLFDQATGNTIADNLVSGNSRDGVNISGTTATAIGSDNVVQGNYIGTDRTATTAYDPAGNALGNLANGISLRDGARSDTIGGIAFGAGNVISGNGQDGIYLNDEQIGPVFKIVIEGNYIGTDVTGTLVSDASALPLGNGFLSGSGNGVDLAFTAFGTNGNLIGGTAFGAGNVISGNVNDGVLMAGNPRTTSNLVQGNYIGTDVTGNLAVDAHGFPFGNGNNGVEISGPANNLVGGTVAGAANVIANNGVFSGTGVGVLVNGSTATGNGIRQNSIYQNFPSAVGISLVAGGNASQPAPVLNAANYVPGTGPLNVTGTVVAAAGSTLEFFANSTPPPTDCEGQLYLGSAPAAPAFAVVLPGVIPPGFNWVSATVTTPSPGFGNTSMFSNCIMINPPPPGAAEARSEPRPAESLAPVAIAPSTGAHPIPQWSLEPRRAGARRDGVLPNPLLRRDLADVVFGSFKPTALPGSEEAHGLTDGLLSRSLSSAVAVWDDASFGEATLFGS
jgi:hypothetical protein